MPADWVNPFVEKPLIARHDDSFDDDFVEEDWQFVDDNDNDEEDDR